MYSSRHYQNLQLSRKCKAWKVLHCTFLINGGIGIENLYLNETLNSRIKFSDDFLNLWIVNWHITILFKNPADAFFHQNGVIFILIKCLFTQEKKCCFVCVLFFIASKHWLCTYNIIILSKHSNPQYLFSSCWTCGKQSDVLFASPILKNKTDIV